MKKQVIKECLWAWVQATLNRIKEIQFQLSLIGHHSNYISTTTFEWQYINMHVGIRGVAH